ncbi:MAG: arsenate reductase ArsC [Proteobacteria bacterium]|nr:arsenate reductase ArsC [Pseudomonadota bacterium]
MSERPYRVLFLCTGNSSRSILAEALLNDLGHGLFRAYSAGSFPKGGVHPLALALLRRLGLHTEGLRTKSWDEFAAPGAPALDFVITVCDDAAGELCPVWPGHPVVAHWGLPDPAHVEGDEATRAAAFDATFRALEQRIRELTRLPLSALDRLAAREAVGRIGNA